MSRHFKRNMVFLLLCLVLSVFIGKQNCMCAEYGAPLMSADGNYEYKLYKPQGSTENQAMITGYVGAAVYVTLPKYFGSYKVTSIGPYAFDYTNVVQVNVPEGYTAVESGAFSQCKQLKTVYLPSTIKTCKEAFQGSTIEYISMGAGTYDIEAAFLNCKYLKKAEINGTVTFTKEAFKNCTSLTTVKINASADYNNFYYTFQGCTSLKDVTIPEKVTFLNSTFYKCTALSRVVLPKTLTELENPFYGCTNLKEVHFEGNDCQWQQVIAENVSHFDKEDTLKQAGVYFKEWDKHVFGAYVVTKKPTTTEYGEQQRTCKVCGYVQDGGLIPKLEPETEESSSSSASSSTAKGVFTVKLKKATMLYTGKKLKMPVKAVYVNGKKIAAKYYTVTYKKNKSVGVATAVVTGKGKYKNYKGTATWKIKVRKSTLISVSSQKKGTLTASWKKHKEAYGYVVQFSQDKSFKTGVKTIKHTSGKTIKTTVGGLKSGKQYYVRVRAYRRVNGSLWYGSWSAKKTATVK